EVWIRQGIKARRTRNEGRVRALQKLRQERSERRERQGQVKMRVENADPSGRLVLEAQDLTFSWPAKKIVQNLDLMISRGDRLGIVGPNGSGKTTLVNLLLGKLEPQEGELRLGTNLQIAYFDQLRQELHPEQTLVDNIGDGKEFIEIHGKNRHVLSYLSDFLFSADRARGPISALSGGERNRLLLARIFSQASNLLVLDEPTNDLDIETLDLLEELLADYAGTVIAVSHDREFLDRVVSSCLIMQENGVVREFVGGYSDWEAQQKNEHKLEQQYAPKMTTKSKTASDGGTKTAPSATPQRKKLSYHEQRELEQLPEHIEKLENSVDSLQKQLSDPEIYSNHLAVQKLQDELQQTEAELLTAYERWEELDGH
ncbi:MAG: ATP-binding cassette domain-containing protein, partial [Fibrobacter sp.]|nr:ATP-binding cassette domain-containing protein [Fibrobacter sp.]